MGRLAEWGGRPSIREVVLRVGPPPTHRLYGEVGELGQPLPSTCPPLGFGIPPQPCTEAVAGAVQWRRPPTCSGC